MFSPSNLRSPLGRARGLGSAKEGLHHWWAQRVTAVALVPLTLWFVISIVRLVNGHADIARWFNSPLNAAGLIAFFAVAYHHGAIGVQVVLEDYVVDHGLRVVSVLLVKLACYALAALAIVSTLIVTLGS